MKLYFEEYNYPIDLLEENLGEDMSLSYAKKDNTAKIRYVGYYYNSKINDTVFIMPKVFVSENEKAFDRFPPEEIIDISPENNKLRDDGYDKVVFELTAWLYQSISHFFERNKESDIGNDISLQNVRVTGEKSSKTIIEIIHSLREFHKRHRNLFTYIAIVNASGNNKVHWSKTIRKEHPIFQDGAPYYLKFQNKNKVINFDEELISLFYSVLHYLSKTYHFDVQDVSGYTLLKSSQIQSMIDGGKGTRLLKKNRHNYFTDELVQLWNLLYDFFDRAEMIASGKNYQERLLVSNFNIIFEDMIDQLISDADAPKDLKEQKDGKIVDHLYKGESIFEEERRKIYYIGDSKYYKETTELGDNSIYKQFTYAKNVIQYNINLFNEKKLPEDLRYRDKLTEGYNITPNFFIRGTIDFDNPSNQDYKLEEGETKKEENKHFLNRLFDRDTLFLQSYNINFMFVVAAYVQNADSDGLKNKIKNTFRTNFIKFIAEKFKFYVLEPKTHISLEEAVNHHFKLLNGKIYRPSKSDGFLILALEKEAENQFENLLLLSQIEKDFYRYDYLLGTDPDEAKKPVEYQFWELPLPMAAESDEAGKIYRENAEKLSKYKKGKQNTILFGIYKDDDHLKWILKEKKYNVRFGDRVGAVIPTLQVTSAEYLVLYEFRNENNYQMYKLSDKHHILKGKDLKDTGYPLKVGGEDNLYYVYEFISKPTKDLGEIDVSATLEEPRKTIAKDGIKKTEDDVLGTPIYVYESEIQKKP